MHDSNAAQGRPRVMTQVAALPYRIVSGQPEILLVSTRDRGRWIVPKGWPIQGMADCDAAAVEAFEEAGARGSVSPSPIGSYASTKRRRGKQKPTEVDLYALEVDFLLDDWPERLERGRLWVSAQAAEAFIAEAGLLRLARSFMEPKTTPTFLADFA